MSKYVVHVEYELNEKPGVDQFHVDAEYVHMTAEWATFENGMSGKANTVAALFPRERVIAIVLDEERSATVRGAW